MKEHKEQAELWVVTGCSGKQDGILVVVKAESEDEAISETVKAAFVLGTRASRQTSPNGDTGWYTHGEGQQTSWVDGDVGWDWQLFPSRVGKDGRAPEAVCW